MHNADENGPRRDRPLDVAGVDPTEGIDRNDDELEAESFQEAAGSKDHEWARSSTFSATPKAVAC